MFFKRRLIKEVIHRATYSVLLEHPFLVHHQEIDTDISAFVASVLDAGGAAAAGASGGAAAMDTSDPANGGL